MKDAICVITLIPNTGLLQFYNKFTNYDVYIIVDDNDFDVSYSKLMYPNCNFVQIPNSLCENSGFQNISLWTVYRNVTDCDKAAYKNVTGWDKAVYKMYQERNNHRFCWIVEDDVFIPHEKTLKRIDNNNIDIDIISNTVFSEGKYNEWAWQKIIPNIRIEKPYYCGMMCAVRFTKQMLEAINDYATKFKSMFYLEAFFPTIAKHYKLKIHEQPLNEMKTITYLSEFLDHDIKITNLYHPIKDIQRHHKLRNLLDSSCFDEC